MDKKCNKCDIFKSLTCFYKQSLSSDGYKTICKDCNKKTRKEYQTNNRLDINKKQKEYAKRNPEKVKGATKTWCKKNKDKIKIDNANYRKNNQEKISQLKKNWNENNKDKIKKQRKEYYNNNKASVLEKNREWNKENSHIVAWRSALRSHLRRFGKKKEGKTIDLLGYSAIDLKKYIEALFISGMTWDNHGEWEIDHIKPVTSFDKETHPSIVNALSNLQPLWKSENRKKYNKYETFN